MATFFANAFDILPIETTQHIASFLEYDDDICNFQLISQSTRNAINADNCSFWRRRYLSCFEHAKWTQSKNKAYKQAYQERKHHLKNGAKFWHGDTKTEKLCLELLRELIVESFTEKPSDHTKTYESSNLSHIKRFISAEDLLQIIFHPRTSKASTMRFTTSRGQSKPAPRIPTDSRPTDLLTIIQVLCAPMLLSFAPHLANHHYSFPDSQIAVYATASSHPIFTGPHGLDINMEFILHNINFWRYHMLREVEGTLYYPFSELEAHERPRWWSSPLGRTGQMLGRHWKGSYAYIEREDIRAMRSGRGESEQVQDNFAGEETACSFQDMRLEVIDEEEGDDPASAYFPWPAAFEQILHSLSLPPSRAKTRAQKRGATPSMLPSFKSQSFRFDGEGQDVTEQFLASGWLNPLPPQQGVPGWQRMTMMKYFEDESEPEGIDLGALWAYEGVVLPGGQIMLGRWWSPVQNVDEEIYSGPFILWCVDGPDCGGVGG